LESYTCELCLHQRIETLRQLFISCPFAKNCWSSIDVTMAKWLRPERATTYLKWAINKLFAMEIIIIMCWSIWKQRNAWIFNAEDPSVARCFWRFKSEFALVILREKSAKQSPMNQWLESLL
jgi:hypothetical protein